MRRSAIAASVVAALAVCAADTSFADSRANPTPPETQGTPPGASLSRTEVIRLADAAAVKKGFILADYLPPHVYYQFLKKDTGTWSIFYDGKVPAPGNHFLVLINDRNKTTEVIPGE
jgi:hypothetical protein